MSQINKISVVGLGKLGLCLATIFADKGYQIKGIDINKFIVDSINQGKSPLFEPGLQELITKNKERLCATNSYDVLQETDATFVIVPTPSDESGEFSLKFVIPVMEQIGKALASKDVYHLVVLSSTVMPGSMDSQVIPVLEKFSGKKCGVDFGLCYNPEFIALGDVIQGFLKPDFVLVGESDPKAGELISEIHQSISSAPIERMNFVNAEISKISVNSYVTMKISFANTLAEICENIPGGDADKITTAIGKDKRIGSAYLKGALGYGGPCFPRDNVAFSRFAQKLGIHAQLADSTHKINTNQISHIIKLIESIGITRQKTIGMLGLTYKPRTDVTEESQPLMILDSLQKNGFDVMAYDPAYYNNDLEHVKLAKSIDDCIAQSELCIFATPWDEFFDIDPKKFENKILLDCWRIFSSQKLPDSCKYYVVGKNPVS